MTNHPAPADAAPYYFKYIDRISTSNIVDTLETQLDESLKFFQSIPEGKSLHRYAPDKWSIRQVLNHLTDAERVFIFRAFWFGRGFTEPLPSFDQEVAAGTALAEGIPWSRHVEEFKNVRLSTVHFFRNLPHEAWSRGGTASGNFVTVNALAYILAGHIAHHTAILRERYL
ncbi:MAG: DinB family protein [Deltaproteobacteria bacterium]